MKKIFTLSLAALALATTLPARAWNYNDGDLLLIFRHNSAYDVEFDLGSVSNFLGHAAGFTTNVTGWDESLVASTFSPLSSASVVLVATTPLGSSPSTAWLSGAEPNTTGYTVSANQWSSRYQSLIHSIGTLPGFYGNPGATNYSAADTNAYVLASGTYGSYDTIVLNGGSSYSLPLFGGHANFTVQEAIPADLDFWATSPTSPSQPNTLIGRFELSSAGVLTFIAGPRPATLTGLTRAGNVSSVNFSSVLGSTYTIAHTNVLKTSITNWPVDATTVTGDGNVDTITHTNSGSTEFYSVIAH